jgi:hypothetical protein
MAGRSGDGWTDVTLGDRVVGFVTGPDKRGRFIAFLDNERAGSKTVGTAKDKTAAVALVQDAYRRS